MKKLFVFIMAMLMAVCMIACTDESDSKQPVADEYVAGESVNPDNADPGAAENTGEDFLGGYGGPGEDYVESEDVYVDPNESEEDY